MAQELGDIGGNSLNNVMANICYRLFSNNVALLYSWSERKKPKSSFEDTNFTTLIINSIRVSHPNATDHEIRTLGSRDKKRADQQDDEIEDELSLEANENDDECLDANDEERDFD
ncbi:uncharacterized protein LOC117171132 [Belonocnema kinseyi]|uniref:uncharacterized protein LOC117171132 n=1 Tax=Belonocnema kinseyi TaxID=2817044 RepID=UPI00143DDCC6|nr:uncharacterized protein LOC117171132 [Belonocnema kinseyi]